MLDAQAMNVAPLNSVPGAVVSLMDRSNVDTEHLRHGLESSRDHLFASAGVEVDLFLD